MNAESCRLIAMLPVHNDAGRFLAQLLAHLSKWVDGVVALDNASTDNSADILASSPIVIYWERLTTNLWLENESDMRRYLWEMTTAQSPGWIVAVDSDEFFEDRIIKEAKLLINQQDYDAVDFRLFDFWEANQYRTDGAWNPWSRFVRLFVCYRPELGGTWPNRVFHCGRWPLEYRRQLTAFQSDIRVKHLGWISPKERQQKFRLYCRKDEQLWGKVSEHTLSISIPEDKIKLEPWVEKINPLLEGRE